MIQRFSTTHELDSSKLKWLWYLGGEDLEGALLRDDGVQEVEAEAVVLPWCQLYRGRELKRAQTPDIRYYPSLAAINLSSKLSKETYNM